MQQLPQAKHLPCQDLFSCTTWQPRDSGNPWDYACNFHGKTPIVCRLIPWVTLLGTITYPLPFPALLSRWFSCFLHVGYISSLEDNRFFSRLKIDDNEFHVMSFLSFFSVLNLLNLFNSLNMVNHVQSSQTMNQRLWYTYNMYIL